MPDGLESSPLTMMSLRCKSCSAPLSPVQSEEIVKCQYCGSTQKLVDARAFVNHIIAQVNAWVRQTMPTSLGASGSSVVDPIARHMVFANNVRPRLSTEYGEYRFQCMNVLSNPLMTLPNMTESGVGHLTDPKEVFLFQAKVQSISALAVDEDGKSLVQEIGGLSIAYAYLLNNLALMSELKPERYHFMHQNLAAAAAALKDTPKHAVLHERMKGLSSLCLSLDLLTSMKVDKSRIELDRAKSHLTNAGQMALSNPEFAIMHHAIKKELSTANSTGHMLNAIMMNPRNDIASSYSTISSLLGILNGLRNSAPSLWKSRFSDSQHHEEILKHVSVIAGTKAGQGSMKIVGGSGRYLFPFWAVDVPYSFRTGALWKTQGVEVTESLLVSATFPMDSAVFNGVNARSIVTDIFGARERSGFLTDTAKRMSGKETSLSGGGPVKDVILRAHMGTPSGMDVIPPLSTPQDAVMIVQTYISQSSQSDRAIQSQLKLSSPRVSELVYVPGTCEGGRPCILEDLGRLAPSSVGDVEALMSIAI